MWERLENMKMEDLKIILPDVCERFGIRYVEVFGSLARNESGNDSDIDLIIEFEEPIERETSKRYFGFLHFLEDHFGRKVDLLTPRSFRNPYLKKSVDRDRVRIYG